MLAHIRHLCCCVSFYFDATSELTVSYNDSGGGDVRLVTGVRFGMALAVGWSVCVMASAHDALGISDWIGNGTYMSTTSVNLACCGRNECAIIEDGAARYMKDGIEVHGDATYFIQRAPWLHQRIDEVVPYTEIQPSEDKYFWRCQWPSPTQRSEARPHRTCFFAPPPGS